jgi:hypothetical protein
VTTPGGGDFIVGGSTGNLVEWTAPANAVSFTVLSSTDNGTYWTVEATGLTGSTYSWTAPATAVDLPDSYIAVYAYDAGGVQVGAGTVDRPGFVVTANLVAVTSPNGGETLTASTTHAITWAAPANAVLYKLRYSLNSGATWKTIDLNVGNVNSYDWIVPNSPTGTALIKVQAFETFAAGGLVGQDISDAVFTIDPPPAVAVTSPNGAESLTIGTTHTITWTAPANALMYKLRYSLNSGATWKTIDLNVGNVNSYDWTVPNSPTGTAMVKVQAFETFAPGGFVGQDVSDAVFDIVLPPPVVVTSPDGAESLTIGATHTITWTAPTNAVMYKLRYSIDSGVRWTPLDLAVGNVNSYDWTVPNMPTGTALIRVQAFETFDPGGYVGQDVSDAVFTIAP